MDRLIQLRTAQSVARVYPEQGFQLHGFDVEMAGRRVPVVHGSSGPFEPWDRRFGNPILFPAVGRSVGRQRDSWEHAGQSLLMPLNGLARDAYWHVEVAA